MSGFEPRTPYDGRPYYCTVCNLGYVEFMACEQTECTLETRGAALARAQDHAEKRAAESETKRRAQRQAERHAERQADTLDPSKSSKPTERTKP